MKRFKYILRSTIVVFLVSLTAFTAKAQNTSEVSANMDSVQISLLTCGPGNEIYSLYGHTAIRVNDIKHQQDLVINYGMFSFRQKFFILRFVFGLTDYEMGIEPFCDFISEYTAEGRWVKEQHLNLNNTDKGRIMQAIAENYQPENRTYRYNYFYDNCTTRARDILTSNISGKINYNENKNTTTSYRDMVHQWTEQHPWARLGNDLLLGIKADSKTVRSQQQFLPDTLRKDFDRATVSYNGTTKKLVNKTEWLIPQQAKTNSGYNIKPWMFFEILLIIYGAVSIAEYNRKKKLWIADSLLFGICGIAGLILFAMIFSQHPTVNVNLQILILCPLLIWSAFYTRHPKKHRVAWICTTIIIAAGIIGNIFQHYDPAISILALILLFRSWLYTNNKK